MRSFTIVYTILYAAAAAGPLASVAAAEVPASPLALALNKRFIPEVPRKPQLPKKFAHVDHVVPSNRSTAAVAYVIGRTDARRAAFSAFREDAMKKRQSSGCVDAGYVKCDDYSYCCKDNWSCCGDDYCCSPGTNCYGFQQCCKDSAETCGGTACCASGSDCCSGGGCCDPGKECCGPDGCCDNDQKCCGNGDGCCDSGYTCCDTVCCPSGTTCASDGTCDTGSFDGGGSSSDGSTTTTEGSSQETASGAESTASSFDFSFTFPTDSFTFPDFSTLTGPISGDPTDAPNRPVFGGNGASSVDPRGVLPWAAVCVALVGGLVGGVLQIV